ncbi:MULTISPECIES: hypothetical protein [unclassified Sphingomonas]|uniref:hypothetical protein n=1 Tax=unclassified Sphingomonas TaxID=196159 RepID=UPI000E1061ED|nr:MULTISPECIES: hypothetical protein [unclassified Sphingomonas]AXJ96302.1 hypothetical protein DM480_13145 [Sphingomonas sp. FARSPH]
MLDGRNNPGFSGGPVLALRPGDDTVHVVGVVSGYCTDLNPIDGAADLWVEGNAGLIYAAPMKPILDAIDARPIGWPFDPAWHWPDGRFRPSARR